MPHFNRFTWSAVLHLRSPTVMLENEELLVHLCTNTSTSSTASSLLPIGQP